jgi:hypothetical protein
MKQSSDRQTRCKRLSALFDRLCEKDQAYLEALTSRLLKIHETSPETQLLTGRTPETIVQYKEQEK